MPDHSRVGIYVDDPIFALAGPPDIRNRELGVALLWMSVVGFPHRMAQNLRR